MLSNSPAVGSLPLEQQPPSLQPQVANRDDEYAFPRQQLGRRAPIPGPPSQPSHEQQLQYGLNTPRPPLSPLSEYHSGFSEEDVGSACPSLPPFSIANHQRQHSFPNLLPLAFRSRTPSPTRKTHTRSGSEQMPYTGDERSSRRMTAESTRGGGGGLGSWLSGNSAAAKALVFSHTSADGYATTPDGTPTRRRNPPGPGSTVSDVTNPKSTITTASRFMSALSYRFNPATPTSPSLTNANTTTTNDDEFSNLNIEAALFSQSPSSPSPSSPRDAFSPSAFKNLYMNAVGLLTRMQAAHREQACALRELRAERSAQQEELEEAVTRASHLKMQLEGMARRAQEQEGVVTRLVEELAAERRARAKEETQAARVAGAGVTSERASMVSEDLGVDEDRDRVRRSGKRSSGWRGSSSGLVEDEETDFEDEDESAESENRDSR
ncbi:hypothetical protein N657DRAFT_672142 [Parathielavia appendiculata]|uniref:Uncharacterized protein n=1 Tax=Parathielavia appendiculata TaxID=2587402 RepID=A0AAN6Z3V0_9PEZI|nr:hypothetical protein N657DRAFT_672142 [Parathielavia appendiculata]